MATCTEGQQPWGVSFAGGSPAATGATAQEACNALGATQTAPAISYWEPGTPECVVCSTGNCEEDMQLFQPVQVCEPATEPTDPEGSVTHVVCTGSCTVTHVIDFKNSPFVMSVEDGAILSGLILGVWLVAFIGRMFIRAVWDSTDADNS